MPDILYCALLKMQVFNLPRGRGTEYGNMILNRPLTAENRRISQLTYNRYSLMNGLAYACLGETGVLRFAIQQGASNLIVAVLGAMLYLGYLLLPLGILR